MGGIIVHREGNVGAVACTDRLRSDVTGAQRVKFLKTELRADGGLQRERRVVAASSLFHENTAGQVCVCVCVEGRGGLQVGGGNLSQPNHLWMQEH